MADHRNIIRMKGMVPEEYSSAARVIERWKAKRRASKPASEVYTIKAAGPQERKP